MNSGWYWLEQMGRRADRLERLIVKRGEQWGELYYGAAEHEATLGFFSIRKLLENHKLPTKFKHRNISVRTYALKKGERVTWSNASPERFAEFGEPSQIALPDLCDEFVHSFFLYTLSKEKAGLAGYFFGSDRKRNTRALWIDAAEVVKLFKLVSVSAPNKLSANRSKETGDWDVIVE
jgi:hypothetical protein